jgi:hypothetical protein
MRPRLLPCVASALALGLLSACATTQPPPHDASPGVPIDPRSAALAAYREALSLAVQGELHAALPRLRQLDASVLDAKRRRTVQDVLARFDADTLPPAPPGLDPWTAEVLTTYRRYWTRVMLGRVSPKTGEHELAQALASLAGADKATAPDMAALEPLLQQRIEAHGLHALFGVTTPLREFMLWRVQDEQRYAVALPEGTEQVQVAMLDRFDSLGWVGWATAERSHSGGWTTPERLYCVRSAYDLGSEAFRVSYLAHEGQHFADVRRFPGLAQPELEYRAKLVEIALADQSQPDLLADFASNGSDSREQPHAYANRRLLRDLQAAAAPGAAVSATAAWWRTSDPAALRAAAVRLLKEDSLGLTSRMPAR